MNPLRTCSMILFSAVTRMNGCYNLKRCISKSESPKCTALRQAHKRVLNSSEPLPEDISSPHFAAAPAIYSFNVPRYFTTMIRAREYGKSHDRRITWFYAKDTPLHRDDRELSEEALQSKMKKWLERHDQDTQHVTSVFL